MNTKTRVLSSILSALLIIGLFGCAPETDGEETEQPEHELGVVNFPISCNEEAQVAFETGLAQLHHMMYKMAQPYFEDAAEADPECAMAYWGIAMTSFQPLWRPTTEDGIKNGKAALARAREIGGESEREEAYISAVEAYFEDPGLEDAGRPAQHQARLEAWVDAQRQLQEKYPDDVDAAAFYGLAEISYAQSLFSPDKERDYTRQIRAGGLMEDFLEEHPEHPGLFHYIIHAYDSPQLAHKGKQYAQEYDKIAPNTPHALHMPSHIFVRLGLWDETIDWNIRSAEAALNHPANGKTSHHYPHALDYMIYGYIQQGDEENADKALEDVLAIENPQPTFISAYGIAASIARYHLELDKWEEAANLQAGEPAVLPWDNFPAANALIAYARGLGAARTGDLETARNARKNISDFVETLKKDEDIYWAHTTEALGDAVEAWILYEEGKTEEALTLMRKAADNEEAMDKHPITPGEVLPVRELYAELLLREDRHTEAFEAFERSLERTPNRKNALAGIEIIQ